MALLSSEYAVEGPLVRGPGREALEPGVYRLLALGKLADHLREGHAIARHDVRRSQPIIARKHRPEDEKIKLVFWLIASLRQREYEWFQYRDGNIDRKIWEAYRTVILTHLTTPRTREWWGSFLSTSFDPEFVAEVNQLIEGNPPTDFFEGFKSSRN